MRVALSIILLFCLPLVLLAADTPSPTPDPRLALLQEVAALRTARALAELQPSSPASEADLAARRRVYEDLIARYPREAEPHIAYGEYLAALPRNEEAFQQWAAALLLDPKRHDVLSAQADILLQTGQIVAAADAWERAAALAPENADYPYGLAHLYTLFRRDLMASRGLDENALITRGTAYFRQATTLAPENLRYAQAYAEAFYTQPNPDWTLARAAWENLLVRSPEKDFIHSHLARVSLRLGDKTAARAHLDAIHDPAFASLREKLQKQLDRL
jgi:tetratricopeptide (TPR) repeat protein